MDPVTLAFIFGGSMLFNFIGASSTRSTAKKAQKKSYKDIGRTRMDMRQAIEIQRKEYQRLGDIIYGYSRKQSPTDEYGNKDSFSQVGGVFAQASR